LIVIAGGLVGEVLAVYERLPVRQKGPALLMVNGSEVMGVQVTVCAAAGWPPQDSAVASPIVSATMIVIGVRM
jgi:hypothetical protein